MVYGKIDIGKLIVIGIMWFFFDDSKEVIWENNEYICGWRGMDVIIY